MEIEKKVMVIKEEILKEASQHKEELVSEEKKKWEKKYQAFQKKIESREEEILLKYKQEAKNKREQIISRAILDRKKTRRTRIDRCIKRFINDLKDHLNKFSRKPAYHDFIINSVKKAVKLLDGYNFVVLLRKEDLALTDNITNSLKEKLPEYTFSIETRKNSESKSGGVIVENEDGKEIVEYTFDAIIEDFREEIAIEIQQTIFA